MTATTATGIWVNLPVENLQKSVAFFTGLGFAFDARFTDDSATCLVLGEDMNVMLLNRERFKSFTTGPVADPRAATGALMGLGVESRAKVDELADKAIAGGGRAYRAAEDHGFMYGRSFQDLDGHVWELFCMDMAAFEKMRKGA